MPGRVLNENDTPPTRHVIIYPCRSLNGGLDNLHLLPGLLLSARFNFNPSMDM